MSLPTDAATRKGIPIFSGLVKYFPHAIAAVAQLSLVANEQHNPGQPLHWAKAKSTDETDALSRHMTDMAIDEMHRDPEGILAAVKLAWRALANLERMHGRGLDIFHNEEQSFPEVEVEENGDITEDELRDFYRLLMDYNAEPMDIKPEAEVETLDFMPRGERLTAYITELNRGYGLPAHLVAGAPKSIDDAAAADWDRVSALRSGRTL